MWDVWDLEGGVVLEVVTNSVTKNSLSFKLVVQNTYPSTRQLFLEWLKCGEDALGSTITKIILFSIHSLPASTCGISRNITSNTGYLKPSLYLAIQSFLR